MASLIGGDTKLRFGEHIPPPPPLPPELRTGPSALSQEGPLKPEEPSRLVTELPELPAFTPLEGSVLAGDWMIQLTPVVGTLSAISGDDWTGVLKEAYSLYSRWLAADPVQRLASSQVTSACADRAEAYGVADRAVPSETRADLVAVRAMTSP